VQHCRSGESILIIAPATVLKVLTCGIMYLPLQNAFNFSVDCGGICMFERAFENGPYQLKQWNDLRYLEKPRLATAQES